MKTLSVILPLLNEEQSLQPVHRALKDALKAVSCPHEIIFVDDGSTDDSLPVLEGVAARDPAVKIISLTENFGQSSALQAGFDHAGGEVLVTLDADLENNPCEIPRLLGLLAGGCDVVCGRRVGRPLSAKKIISFLSNRAFRLLLGSPVRDIACTLRAYRREALDGLVLRGSLHRYLPYILHLRGAVISEVPVRFRPRRFGSSKYTLSGRIWPTLKDLHRLLFHRRAILRNRIREYTIGTIK